MDNQPASTPRATEIVLDDVNLEGHLGRVLEFAREQTGARYAALCVLNDARDGLARFITVGSGQAPSRRSAWCRGVVACSAI